MMSIHQEKQLLNDLILNKEGNINKFINSKFSIEKKIRILSKLKQKTQHSFSIKDFISQITDKLDQQDSNKKKHDKELLLILFKEEYIRVTIGKFKFNINVEFEKIINPRKLEIEFKKSMEIQEELSRKIEVEEKNLKGTIETIEETKKTIQNMQKQFEEFSRKMEEQSNEMKSIKDLITNEHGNLRKDLITKLTAEISKINDKFQYFKKNEASLRELFVLLENQKKNILTDFEKLSSNQYTNGYTPLHYAIQNNLQSVVDLLISQGEDINAKDMNYQNMIILFLIMII